MFTTLLPLSLVLLPVWTVFAQSDLSISTPTLTQCESAQISWSDTCSGPYQILVASADDMCGAALEDLGYHDSDSMTWLVNIAAGTEVVLYISDEEGNDAWSGNVTVQASNNTTCLSNTTSSPSSTPTTPWTYPNTSMLPSASHSSPASSGVPASGNGLSANSGVLSMRPFGTVTVLGATVLAVAAFAL